MKISTFFSANTLCSLHCMIRISAIIFCYFASVSSVLSQSTTFSILPSNTITGTAVCGTTLNAFTFNISNDTTVDLDLSYTAVTNTMPSDTCWEYMFCDWNQCYSNLPIGTMNPPILVTANSQNSTMLLDITTFNNKGQGSYALTVFETNKPTSSQTITWNISGCVTGTDCGTSGISEPANNTGFVVYPNPAQEHINVRITQGYKAGSSVEVFNIVGEKLIESEIKMNTLKIDLKTLPAGAYFIKYDSGTGSSVKNFFKVN